MKIGIIGAENSHAAAIAKLINVDKKIEDCEVTMLWGETKEFAEKTQKDGQIPAVVADYHEMLGKVDGVIIDHRDGKYHLPAATPFVKAGVPVFVDKPLCCDLAEGKRFLKLARKCKTPVTSFSIVSRQGSFAEFKKELAGLGNLAMGVSVGPCDIESQWGGIFFYGIHQVDLLLAAFGTEVVSAQVNLNGDYSTGTLYYKSGFVATMSLLKKNAPGFGVLAVGEKGTLYRPIVYDADSPFMQSTRTVVTMFRTRSEPEPYADILARIAVLQALQRSITLKGKRVSVKSFAV